MSDTQRHELADLVKRLVDAEMAPLIARIADLEREIADMQWRSAAMTAAEMDADGTHPPSLTAN
ncbi:hypothetical protein [Methylocystis sp.]|uniref:hypothetical protein n=1 Tax=Methylocystis sp. TaxID=1911079 RepID=UPI003DA45C89